MKENREDPNSGIGGTEESITEDDPNSNGRRTESHLHGFNYRILQMDRSSRLSGQSQQIVAENCGGITDIVQVFEISRFIEVKVFLELSTTIIREFEAFEILDIEFAVDVISNEVECKLGIDRAGIDTEFTSALEILTEADTITIATVEWRETWSIGKVEIIRLDGSVVDVLPFSCLNFIFLELRDIEVIECHSNTEN